MWWEQALGFYDNQLPGLGQIISTSVNLNFLICQMGINEGCSACHVAQTGVLEIAPEGVLEIAPEGRSEKHFGK